MPAACVAIRTVAGLLNWWAEPVWVVDEVACVRCIPKKNGGGLRLTHGFKQHDLIPRSNITTSSPERKELVRESFHGEHSLQTLNC